MIRYIKTAIMAFSLAFIGCDKSGTVTYCYALGETEINKFAQSIQYYQLWGFRPYQSDLFLGEYRTIQEADVVAKTLGCPWR